jgi:hypothetical protein
MADSEEEIKSENTEHANCNEPSKTAWKYISNNDIINVIQVK